MADEAFWFEPVGLLPRCSLSEALLWVWAERVPLYNMEREEHAFEHLAGLGMRTSEYSSCSRRRSSRAAHYRTEDRLRKS